MMKTLAEGGDYKIFDKEWENLALGSQPNAIAALVAASSNFQKTAHSGVGRIVFSEETEFVSTLIHNEETIREADAERDLSFREQHDEEYNVFVEEDEVGKEKGVINNHATGPADHGMPFPEPAVGKGLSGVLQLLRQSGTLKAKEGQELPYRWEERNMDKSKKRKPVAVKEKEIIIERRDEFGRVMSAKEQFKKQSHKFHGKAPGKKKLEKRMKKYEQEQKLLMKSSSDTMQKMREFQALRKLLLLF